MISTILGCVVGLWCAYLITGELRGIVALLREGNELRKQEQETRRLEARYSESSKPTRL